MSTASADARKLARNAQHGLGFYITLAVRKEGKGTRAINGHDAGRDAPSHSCRKLWYA